MADRTRERVNHDSSSEGPLMEVDCPMCDHRGWWAKTVACPLCGSSSMAVTEEVSSAFILGGLRAAAQIDDAIASRLLNRLQELNRSIDPGHTMPAMIQATEKLWHDRRLVAL